MCFSCYAYPSVTRKEKTMGFALSDMQLTSKSFKQDGNIPSRHTGDGEDVSPHLAWKPAPAGTRSYAVICHDPDAPLVSANGTYGFVHWVLYNIPASVTELKEGVDAYTTGANDFGRRGYGGPMPPAGHGKHHYYFWVLALKREPNLRPELSLWELLKEVEPAVIGMNRYMGCYKR
jgi:Raf kinase inhibitor-like YbhB/YbcL family protein